MSGLNSPTRQQLFLPLGLRRGRGGEGQEGLRAQNQPYLGVPRVPGINRHHYLASSSSTFYLITMINKQTTIEMHAAGLVLRRGGGVGLYCKSGPMADPL